ncbi:MAG TPA: cupin domain-containing protein [Thermoleophilia bacterium]|nr:cupin domain-containing protein [Thermoleophilia bacterium]
MPGPTASDERDQTSAGERWPARLVGGRLRAVRAARAMTLDDVAGAAGLTKSFMSAVERGETSPSIGSLYRICEVLGISMSALFETEAAPAANVVRHRDVRAVSFGGEGVDNYVLSPRGERRAQVIETHIAPGGSPGPEAWSHSGDLVIATVLEGAVEFRFDDRSTVLRAGDTIAYSPAEPHSWGNPDDDAPAVALFFGMPAEY